MAAGAWTFTNAGRTSLIDGTFDINSDSWKCALFQDTSNVGAASTTYAGLTNEVANNPSTTGYTTGGIAITLTLSGTTTVTVDISAADTLQILLTKPDGTVLTKTATNPSGSKLRYTTQSGDLSVGGTWMVRGRVVDTGVYDKTSQSSLFYVNG